MADMEKRVELNTLLDFYGPLLTEHRRELVRLYCEEDLSLAEIADAMDITRQGVSDAIQKARRQLNDYEDKLGMVARYQALIHQAEEGLEVLRDVKDGKDRKDGLERVEQSLLNIIQIER